MASLNDRIFALLSQGHSLNTIGAETGASANLIRSVAQGYTPGGYSVTDQKQRAFDLLSAGHAADDVADLLGLPAYQVGQVSTSTTFAPSSGFGPAQAGGMVVGSPLDFGVRLYNPRSLRRWRAAMADALYARVPIVCAGDSITFGQGSDGVNSANNVPDNTQGWVGQLRTLLAGSPFSGVVNSGEGFLFYTDSRITTTGAATGANAYSGPLRHSIRLLSGQTLSLTIPTGAGGTLQIIQANNSGDSTGSYTINAGGSVGLTTLTGTGTSIVTSVTVNAGDAIVISGPASAQTYIAGVVLQSGTTGIPVHRVGIAGYVTGDALGGQTSGALNLTTGQQTSAIKKLYEWAGGPGLLILSFGANDQQFQAGGGTTAQNGVTPSLYTAWMQQIVNQATGDGWDVLLLGEPPNPGAANVTGGQESDYRSALRSIALATDHCAYLNTIDVWGTATLANGRGLQITSSVHPTRKGHGDIARLVYQAIVAPFGENSYTA